MALTRSKKIILLFLFWGYYQTTFTRGLPAPFLPRLCEHHNLSAAVTGWMLGFLPLLTSISTSFWGRFSGTIGVRNTLVVGLSLVGIFTTAFGCMQFIPTESRTLFTVLGFTIRTGHAIGYSAVIPTSQAMVADLFPEHKTFMLSLIGSLGAVGILSGPLVASGLFKLGGFWLVFVATGVIILATSANMIWFLPHYGQNSKPVECQIPYRKIFLNKETIISLATGMFLAACWGGMDPILEPELRSKYEFKEEFSALIFAILPGFYLVISPIIGRFAGKKCCVSSISLISFASVILMVAFLLAGPSTFLGLIERPLWLLLICLAIMGFVNACIFVPAQDIFFNIKRLGLDEDGDNQLAIRGVMAGAWNTWYSFGTFSGMTFSGAFSDLYGWSGTMTAYATGSLILTLTTAIYMLFICAEGLKNNEIHSKEGRPYDSDVDRKFTADINNSSG